MLSAAEVVRLAYTGLAGSWFRLWFRENPTTPIEIIRIGIGAALLLKYGYATPHIFMLWGDQGWLPHDVMAHAATSMWQQSVFFYFTATWQWIAFHASFLVCCAAFIVGWRTSWVKWIVLIGHVSYAYRNEFITYGADKILAHLIFILCLAPIGRAMSLDRIRVVRAAKRADLQATLPAFTSSWVGACTRLIQIQMAVIMFYSGIDKLRGDDWWHGEALWEVFVNVDRHSSLLLDLFASQFWLVNLGSYATVLIEIAYPFLIWQRRTRPFLLAAAILLHLLFAVFMLLFMFSFVMILGHLSFLRPQWLAHLGDRWKRRFGKMEMIYDGRCGFCVRSMRWFLAFDELGQIRIRNFRTDPSPVVSDDKVEKALYVVLPDGRAMPGFEAYRYVVLRVPGMWWQVPFFYVPVLSRLFGHPIYNWIAANRGKMPF